MASAFLICITLLLASTDHLFAQDDSQLADAINTFGIKYYKTQVNRNQNTIASGFSMATIDTMLLAGARGNTETDLLTELGYDTAGLTNEQIESGFSRILMMQQNHGPGYELDVANSLWIQSGFPVLPDYTSNLETNFLADQHNTSFGTSSSSAAIRSWVERVTKATRLRNTANLFRGFAGNQQKVVLMNALYFSARMKIKLDRRQLRFGAFTDGVTQRTARKLVVGTTNMYNYTYSQDLNADVLELPYNGDEVSMFIVLPRSTTGLQAIENTLTLAELKAAEGALTTKKVALTMPFISDFNQVGTVSYLAVEQMDDIEDDLSGIDGKQDLFQSEDDQTEIFRYGLEALRPYGSSLSGKPDVTFRANHPFLFYFRHKPTDIILFMGRMVRPLGNGIL